MWRIFPVVISRLRWPPASGFSSTAILAVPSVVWGPGRTISMLPTVIVSITAAISTFSAAVSAALAAIPA